MQLPASELILNNRGGIYHLDLLPEEIVNDIIVVGDPERVKLISERFDARYFFNQHREFASSTGRIGNKDFTVLSTGIGTDNIDIVWNELDALANIDFSFRTIKDKHTALNVFRLGTCGTIQPDIQPGELVLSTHSIGLDNLLWFYQHQPLSNLETFTKAIQDYAQHIGLSVNPYVAEASKHYTTLFSSIKNQGFTLTAPGFYAPQGRKLRLNSVPEEGVTAWRNFSFNNSSIVNFEMETSALFALGSLLNHNVGALCVVLANRLNNAFHTQPEQAVNRLLDTALTELTAIGG